MDVVNKDMQGVGVTEEDERDELLWQPLNGEARIDDLLHYRSCGSRLCCLLSGTKQHSFSH